MVVVDQTGPVSRKLPPHSDFPLNHRFLRPILVEPAQLVPIDPHWAAGMLVLQESWLKMMLAGVVPVAEVALPSLVATQEHLEVRLACRKVKCKDSCPGPHHSPSHIHAPFAAH